MTERTRPSQLDISKLMAFVLGPHTVGTTAIARWLATRLGIPLIPDPVRVVVGEMEVSLDSVRSDIFLANQYQPNVFERKIEFDCRPPPFVADQGPENVLYALAHTEYGLDLYRSEAFELYLELLRSSVVFYVLPHRSLLTSDGFRPESDLDWGEVKFIDGMLFFLLETRDISYYPIAAKPWLMRIRELEAKLGVIKPPPITIDLPGVAARIKRRQDNG